MRVMCRTEAQSHTMRTELSAPGVPTWPGELTHHAGALKDRTASPSHTRSGGKLADKKD